MDKKVTLFTKSTLQLPVTLSDKESSYILKLHKRNEALFVLMLSQDTYTLRNRHYLSAEMLEQEKELLTTTQLNRMIEKQYLVKVDALGGYHMLKPHPKLVRHFKKPTN